MGERRLVRRLVRHGARFEPVLCRDVWRRLGLIQRSFERFFWIPEVKTEDVGYEIRGLTPWVRGIYKDVLGCHDEWCMLQLRPNQAVAMAVAPFLFDAAHARV